MLLQPLIITFSLYRLSKYLSFYKRLLTVDYTFIVYFIVVCLSVCFIKLKTSFLDNRSFGFGLNKSVLPVEYINNNSILDSPNLFSVGKFEDFFSFFYNQQGVFNKNTIIQNNTLYSDLIGYKSDKIVDRFFSDYDINLVVLPNQSHNLFEFFKKTSKWEKFYQDNLVIAYKRK